MHMRRRIKEYDNVDNWKITDPGLLMTLQRVEVKCDLYCNISSNLEYNAKAHKYNPYLIGSAGPAISKPPSQAFHQLTRPPSPPMIHPMSVNEVGCQRINNLIAQWELAGDTRLRVEEKCVKGMEN